MFHQIKAVAALPDYRLMIRFLDGTAKIYDVKPLFQKWTAFQALENAPEVFMEVNVDAGGYGIVWSDDLDLSCEELYANGQPVRLSDDVS